MTSKVDDLAGTGQLSRRSLLVGLPLLVAACQTTGVSTNTGASLTGASHPPLPGDDFDYAAAYAARTDYDFKVPAVPYKNFDRKYWRQVVDYDGGQAAGTVVVDPYSKFLYLVLPGGKALRYGIGVGKAGFAWSGDAKIRVKRVWPLWRPPREMIARNPHLEKYWKDGYPRGPQNPLGARALGPLAGQCRHALPHSRHEAALQHRPQCVVWLHPHVEPGRDGPVRARSDPHQGRGAVQGPEDVLTTTRAVPAQKRIPPRPKSRAGNLPGLFVQEWPWRGSAGVAVLARGRERSHEIVEPFALDEHMRAQRGVGRRRVACRDGVNDCLMLAERIAHPVSNAKLKPSIGFETVLERTRLLGEKCVAAHSVDRVVEGFVRGEILVLVA